MPFQRTSSLHHNVLGKVRHDSWQSGEGERGASNGSLVEAGRRDRKTGGSPFSPAQKLRKASRPAKKVRMAATTVAACSCGRTRQ